MMMRAKQGNMKARGNFEKTALVVVLFFGILLPSIQFAHNRSLWLDESWLALNIIGKSCMELFRPLDYHQVAPILFLQAEKLFSGITPNSEHGLRLFPLLCYWLSLYLFYKLLGILFRELVPRLFALTLFVFNSTLIYFSSEAKQYMTDVLVVIAVFYLLLKSYPKEAVKYWVLAGLGAVAIFASSISPIILFCAGACLLYEFFRGRERHFGQLLGISLLWLFMFFLYYCVFVEGHPARGFLLDYWAKANAFMPPNPLKSDFFVFLRERAHMVFVSLLPFGIFGKVLLSALYGIGLWALAMKKKGNLLVLLCLPVALHLLFSSFKLFPFHLRLILYITPLAIITTTFGLAHVFAQLAHSRRPVSRRLVAFVPLVFIVIFVLSGFPREREEIKKSIDFIRRHAGEKDKIYVYYGAIPAFTYYRWTNYAGTSMSVIPGGEHRQDSGEYLHELKGLRGRNWLLFSHVYKDEEADIITSLNSLGCTPAKAFHTVGSSVYLYDWAT